MAKEKTLEKSYLKRNINGKIVERPQHLFMRMAIGIHYRTNRMDLILETYELLSLNYFIHGTPTMYNIGTMMEQCSSCYLLGCSDSMHGLTDCLKESMLISASGGGISISATVIRGIGAYIKKTQGKAGGMRVLLVFNAASRYADQGGKRRGAFAIYLEPWHKDIEFFLDLKKNTGAETERARDLFFGLMINDIFMERVEQDGDWCLMCPSECPKLVSKYGAEFNTNYLEYEKNGPYVKKIKARELWFKIMESQIETGVPYIIFKDAANSKSNQQNIGVINSSNLCAEILEVSSANETSVCNLVSICLPKFVYYDNGKPMIDYHSLYKSARVVCRNLNNVIDINDYPTEKTRMTNLRDRPLGMGVQGLADVFIMLKTPFDSELARDINRKIFETIYFGALTESVSIAKHTKPYDTFPSSPFSKGLFQFDLWPNFDYQSLSGMWDWESLRKKMVLYGTANSLLTTCMPTASTAQIMANNESIEPYTENIYIRSTLAGEHYIVNKHLMKDLIELGLWNNDMLDMIKYYEGSIANIVEIPDHIKQIYRTVWEIPQKSLIDMSADRAPFIDQTQSLNIFIQKPSFIKLASCLFHGWKRGLKTGMYYLRSKAASEANKFGIDISKIQEIEEKNSYRAPVCRYMKKGQKIDDECTQCHS